MQSYLYDIDLKPKTRLKVFRDSLYLLKQGESAPFAYRSPAPVSNAEIKEGEVLYEYGGFRISRSEAYVICEYGDEVKVFAVFESLEGEPECEAVIENVIGMLGRAPGLDPYMRPLSSAQSFYRDYVYRTAEICGTLTDFYCEDEGENVIPFSSEMSKNSAYLAIVLPALALMYRRISAYRGFNFKITVSESFPCLVFSARVLTEEALSLPETDVIKEFEKCGRLAFYYKLKEDEGELSRLSAAICPQICDPSDLLRAPALLKQSKKILKGIDIDVPGKY